MTKIIRNNYKKLVNYLEDPQYPSVGPHLHALTFLGLWDPSKRATLKYNKIHYYFILVFFFTIYIKTCFFAFNAESLKTILKYIPFHVGILKAYTFRRDRNLWENLLNYMSSVEHNQLYKKEKTVDGIIHSYIKHNRRVTYFFWISVFFADFLILTEPFQKNLIVENGTSVYYNMFDGYTPFDKEPPGYYCSMVIQIIVGFTVSAYILAWDALVVSIMIFFAGQMQVARVICAQIIEEDRSKSFKNIAEFHRYFVTLIKYQRMFNNIISPIMFIYLIVASVNLGVCTIQIVALNEDLIAVIWSCVYVLAILLQLLLFYWHSNEVTVQSLTVRYGTFESNWLGAGKKLQKEIVLLGFTTNTRLVFKAGPFTEMSLYVFTAILRGTYSFYTLLNETN